MEEEKELEEGQQKIWRGIMIVILIRLYEDGMEIKRLYEGLGRRGGGCR